MKPLSPVDAISPAFSRTRTLLFPPGLVPGLNAPFRFGFFLKIVIIAALTQANVYGAVLGVAAETLGVLIGTAAGVLGLAVHMHHRPDMGAFAGGFSSIFVAVAAIALFFVLALGVLLTWVWCRLRFTLFDLVLDRHGLVSRAWAPYGSRTWRLFGLMVLIGLSLTLLLAVTAGPLILHLFLTIRHLTPQEINSDPSVLFADIFPMYGIVFLIVLLVFLADAVTQDFILPPMAIDDAPLASAFSRFFQFLRARFWTFALYLLLRFVLEIGLAWVGMMALFIVLAVAAVAGGGAGFVLYHFFWHAGPAGMTLFVVYCVIAGLLLIALYLLLLFALYGVIALVKQSFAVYFYGGYYPALGDRLEPPPAPPAAPAPEFPPPFAPLPGAPPA